MPACLALASAVEQRESASSFHAVGDGAAIRQLLAIYCEKVNRAPKLNGWTFYASRQTRTIEGI